MQYRFSPEEAVVALFKNIRPLCFTSRRCLLLLLRLLRFLHDRLPLTKTNCCCLCRGTRFREMRQVTVNVALYETGQAAGRVTAAAKC
ncbi:hypothetical protein JOB18_035036 [Solea senegalensis]|uniref:Uncharacterized protein n=1 Tax=Solea senegalensis TaxID=28829 RepID=A0AAV6T0V8_SOLSE|nr:hypothetical protein JOB18_035036 [Solea senegalensis]